MFVFRRSNLGKVALFTSKQDRTILFYAFKMTKSMFPMSILDFSSIITLFQDFNFFL